MGWLPKADKDYKKTRKGVSIVMYTGQKYCSRRRGHPEPEYTLEQFREWLFAQPNFEELYLKWVDSGYQKNYKPSVNRIDNSKHYTFDNIELITFKENWELGLVEQHGENKFCRICQRPKDAVGSQYCSYPHPISRQEHEMCIDEMARIIAVALENNMIRDIKTNEPVSFIDFNMYRVVKSAIANTKIFKKEPK